MVSAENLVKELETYFNNINKGVVTVFGENSPLFYIQRNASNGFGFFYPQGQIEPITDESLRTKHYPLAILFESIKNHNLKLAANLAKIQHEEPPLDKVPIYSYTPLAKTNRERLLSLFILLNIFAKWVARKTILDNFISKYTIGVVIAAIANHGNSHYKTEANTIVQTLAPLIFPAGLKKPNLDEDGDIYLDPILTAQYKSLINFQNNYVINDTLPHFRPFKIKVKENTVVAGITASNYLAKQPENAVHLHVLYFTGNSGCYQGDADLIAQDLLAYERDFNLPVTSVEFNYPGVLNSTGKVSCAQDLIDAGIAQVERINKELKIPYHKIGLHGVSLGGSIAAHVANFYHQRGIKLAGTYVSRTFSSTTNVALSYIEKVPYIGKTSSSVLRPVIAFGLWGSGWQLDTAKKFCELPENKRNYSVVRSNKYLRNLYQPHDDPVLVHSASLHKSWRLALLRFFHKLGLFGYDKKTYQEVNRSHKLMVIEKANDELPFTYRPDICGHRGANFNAGITGIFLYQRGLGKSKEIEAVLPDLSEQNCKKETVKLGKESGLVMRSFFAQVIQNEVQDLVENAHKTVTQFIPLL